MVFFFFWRYGLVIFNTLKTSPLLVSWICLFSQSQVPFKEKQGTLKSKHGIRGVSAVVPPEATELKGVLLNMWGINDSKLSSWNLPEKIYIDNRGGRRCFPGESSSVTFIRESTLLLLAGSSQAWAQPALHSACPHQWSSTKELVLFCFYHCAWCTLPKSCCDFCTRGETR